LKTRILPMYKRLRPSIANLSIRHLWREAHKRRKSAAVLSMPLIALAAACVFGGPDRRRKPAMGADE
jgi:hypothetical protein